MRPKFFSRIMIAVMSLMLTGCMSPVHWWANINHKAKELQSIRARHAVLEKEYEALKLEHLELEHKFQTLQAEFQMAEARKDNASIAGNEEGRHLANIPFTVPKNLGLKERFKLAMEHIEHKKFAEAFVLFESVLWVPEGAQFQNITAFYNAGVAAFEIKNFNRAKEYFEAASAHGDGLKDTEMLRRTQLWLKIIERTSGRKVASHE